MHRTILLSDCDSFFASVEIMLDPSLKGRPVAVAGDPKNRHGVVVARNIEAKRFGVRTTDTVSAAKRKCPDIILVPPHHKIYEEVSEKVNHIYLEYTELVEPYSIDESYLDVTKLTSRTGGDIADELRRRVKNEIGITVSVGVSFNKCFAKLACEINKPDGTTYIPRDKVTEMVYPLPVSRLLYVGESTCKELDRLGIKTIGDLASADEKAIFSRLGKHGRVILKYAKGLDDELVHSYYEPRETKSVGNGLTFKRDIVGEREIHTGVASLTESVAATLRGKGLKCNTVQVTIKSPNLSTIQRQTRLSEPTYLMKDIVEAAMSVIKKNWDMSSPIRALTVTCSDFVPEDYVAQQISIFDDVDGLKSHEKQEKIEKAISTIRQKYGKEAISYGYLEDKDIGITNTSDERLEEKK
jgi:DNA polymerase-4